MAKTVTGLAASRRVSTCYVRRMGLKLIGFVRLIRPRPIFISKRIAGCGIVSSVCADANATSCITGVI